MKNDLDNLSQVFHSRGIGCRSFLYDGFNFPEPLSGVRFAFFDIHLNQSAEPLSTLRDAISKYISKENGPYVLIFWSNRAELVPDFLKFVNRTTDEFSEKLKPISLEIIDKSEFLSDHKSLEYKLDEILSKDIVKCLIEFEEAVLTAAMQTLDSILSTIPFDDLWGKSDIFNSNCQAVFSKIAESAYGFTHAKENPDAAICESITPIFENILLQNTKDNWKKYLLPLQNANKSSDIIFPKNYSPATLNTIFHVDKFKIATRSKTERGAVCPIDKSKVTDVFKSIFNVTYDEWFSITFPGLTNEDKDIAMLIAIEFSAACDYSQNKKRTNKYILGIMIPAIAFNKLKKKNIGAFLVALPFSFELDGKNYKIGVNLNYTFTEHSESNILEKPIFFLKKDIMNMIGNKYANHISRIGITSF